MAACSIVAPLEVPRHLPARAGRLWRVVHAPRIAVRAEPSLKAEVVFVFAAGEVFRVGRELDSGWVELSEDEAWVHQIAKGFVLVDGAAVGLGPLIEALAPDATLQDSVWPFSLAVRRANLLGVPFELGAQNLRPVSSARLSTRWLSSWHGADTPHPVSWAGHLADVPALPAKAPTSPRLAVASLVRGASASCLQSFVQYHLAVGFERVSLFFDQPEEAEEEAVAQSVQQFCTEEGLLSHVQIHLCTHCWWAAERQESRFYLRRGSGDRVYADMVDLHEVVRDVQARQCLVVDRALREARMDGFDWLLHIDVDEALLVPQHRDARAFFATVGSEFDQVCFRNHEAVPESFEIGDWFREVTLFKVHQGLLREDPCERPDGSARQRRLEKWRARKLAKGCDPEDVEDNRTFNHLMFATRMMRRDFASTLGLDLPAADPDSEFESESESERDSTKAKGGWTRDVPCYFTAYTNGKSAVRVRPDAPPPLPVGVHRCTSDSNGPLRSLRCRGPGVPVVLHYANCGFSAWMHKYDILSKGHGTDDGGFSLARKGVVSMRAHLAHRELNRRGDRSEMEAYYRTFIMSSKFGELPYFAGHGMLARVPTVRDVLERA